MARLIDADALLDTLKFLANRSYNRKLTTSYSNAYKECMEFVKHAPTIEPTLQHVESVGEDGSALKHGYWIDINEDGSLWECSICGDRSCCCGNYCMECGAKMVEPKHGHWIREPNCWYRCSECGSIYPNMNYYCPDCGAKIDGEEEDDEID